ncbi:hypothetical protein [Vibrio sagamiensis]|uniref:Uncharacterized protein n=1 Tax=Vibrio sagamiensis NBRC 104589 TaxID=1219064 RepID=A0A511QIU5_9VIBR|nr:hypothetical protein [Vibrio sagamiensis]PNQ69882.1 hypothetical protein C1141_05525 [Vibrio agarivorans]GEM77245.1 hypothetical protein VSA01S_33570 [Vibrio sagamiensis NBRC 104589]
MPQPNQIFLPLEHHNTDKTLFKQKKVAKQCLIEQSKTIQLIQADIALPLQRLAEFSPLDWLQSTLIKAKILRLREEKAMLCV